MALKRQSHASPMDDFEDRYITSKSKKKMPPKPPKGKLPIKGKKMDEMPVKPKKKPKKGKK